jgi:hypothetical protein
MPRNPETTPETIPLGDYEANPDSATKVLSMTKVIIDNVNGKTNVLIDHTIKTPEDYYHKYIVPKSESSMYGETTLGSKHKSNIQTLHKPPVSKKVQQQLRSGKIPIGKLVG